MRIWAIILVVIGFIFIAAVSMPVEGSVPVDPFAPYADLLTQDQTLHALINRKFSCVSEYLSEPRQNCWLVLDDATFSKINVTIVNGIPRDISFQIRKDSIQVGDLALVWGKPDGIFTYASPNLTWQDQNRLSINAFVRISDHLDYLAPVQVVMFSF